MGYFKVALVLAGLAALGYFKRHGFRRAWYVLRTGEEKPDWEKLGSQYFLGRKAKE
jgi:hypothetical protein